MVPSRSRSSSRNSSRRSSSREQEAAAQFFHHYHYLSNSNCKSNIIQLHPSPTPYQTHQLSNSTPKLTQPLAEVPKLEPKSQQHNQLHPLPLLFPSFPHSLAHANEKENQNQNQNANSNFNSTASSPFKCTMNRYRLNSQGEDDCTSLANVVDDDKPKLSSKRRSTFTNRIIVLTSLFLFSLLNGACASSFYSPSSSFFSSSSSSSSSMPLTSSLTLTLTPSGGSTYRNNPFTEFPPSPSSSSSSSSSSFLPPSSHNNNNNNNNSPPPPPLPHNKSPPFHHNKDNNEPDADDHRTPDLLTNNNNRNNKNTNNKNNNDHLTHFDLTFNSKVRYKAGQGLTLTNLTNSSSSTVMRWDGRSIGGHVGGHDMTASSSNINRIQVYSSSKSSKVKANSEVNPFVNYDIQPSTSPVTSTALAASSQALALVPSRPLENDDGGGSFFSKNDRSSTSKDMNLNMEMDRREGSPEVNEDKTTMTMGSGSDSESEPDFESGAVGGVGLVPVVEGNQSAENDIQMSLVGSSSNQDGGQLQFVESPPTGAIKSREKIIRDLSRLSANLRTNSATVVVDSDNDNINKNKCDRLYLSGADGIRNGTFESPALAAEEGHSLQCIYTFVARPSERVEIIFTHFNVRGTPPECVHEWVDLYTEVEDTDVSDLISTPFGGRYCGKIPPRRRISLYGGIAIGFYSDKNTTEDNLFRGTYAFISEDRFVVGTPMPRTICSYSINSTAKRAGELVSPTYPGVYPKDLSCTYKFQGSPGQRIRLEFRDFDLFFGGTHCPFDDVKIYDGEINTAPLIGTYCGQQRNLVVYSSEHLMLVTFTTLERNTEAQNRGFSAVWEFSESFVKLDFITKNTGEHIRGTECDQRILSKGHGDDGHVYSPNYPFPYLPKIVCRYFVYGLQDPQHLERVRLDFDKFDVPTNSNSEEDVTNQAVGHKQHSTGDQKCGDGFLKIYIKGQEVIQAYDKADFEFCGKELPHNVVSDGPRMVLVFSSGETQGSGFKAKYVFETEYRVPGTAAPSGECRFSYLSSSQKKGEFNSPRFPSNYPSEINCTYTFTAEPNEQIRLVFDHFKVKSDKVNYTGGTYGDMCQEDWVEIFNTWKGRDDRLIGRYCGLTAPGPIESREGAQALKLVLHTDEEGVYSGFKAKYIFFTAKSIYGECGRNITQDHSGVLTTPNWPAPYDGPQRGEGSSTCNWYLTVRPGSRVMLHFQVFNIEGSPKDRGCPAAAVRIWEDIDGIPVELCGEKLPFDQSQYVSTRNIMRVTFITADKAVGAGGFQAVWTEVQDGMGGASCHHSYFRCTKSQFCIPNELRCNGHHNCGNYNNQEIDTSDEEHCGIEGDMNLILMIISGVAGVLAVFMLLCIYAQRKRRKQRRRLQLRRPPIHVCDNAGARFAAMDSV